MIASVLAVILGVSGCTTTEYIHVTPSCTPPPEPSLPVIDRGEMWDKLEDDLYRDVERYITDLWGYADEQAAILDTICE